MVILCKSKRAAQRTYESILPYIEGKLFLRVNREKTKVADIGRIKFLGYGFRYSKDGIKATVHRKSKEKLKAKVKEITKRNDGRGYEWKKQRLKYLVRGWVNYFKLADMKTFLTETDEWMRTRLRTYIWKAGRRSKTAIETCVNLECPSETQGSWQTREKATGGVPIARL